MATFKRYFVIDCVSFAILILVYTAVALAGVTTLNEFAVFLLFVMTSAIAVLMFLTDKLPIKNPLLNMLVNFLDCVIVVFGMGCPFGFIPVEAPLILTVLGMIAIVYFATFGILVIKAHADADIINKQLEKRKQRRD